MENGERAINRIACDEIGKRKLGSTWARCRERYHLHWLCEAALIYSGKTDLVVTVSWKRSWIFNSVLIKAVEPLKARDHMSANNSALCYLFLPFSSPFSFLFSSSLPLSRSLNKSLHFFNNPLLVKIHDLDGYATFLLIFRVLNATRFNTVLWFFQPEWLGKRCMKYFSQFCTDLVKRSLPGQL